MSTTLALALLAPGAAGPQVVISETKIEVGGEAVLTTADAVPLYARGTGANNPANRLVMLGDAVLVDDANRGLTLTVLDADTQSEVSSANYDTWASDAAADALAVALDTMDSGQMGILTSYDAFERALTVDLRASAFRLGLLRLAATPSVPDADERRHPYAAIFYGSAASAPSPQVVEIAQSKSAGAPHAILVSWLIGDGFVGQGHPPVTPPPRYVDRGDGTVWDTWSNLFFLKEASCGSLGPNGDGTGNWLEAAEAAAALADGPCSLRDESEAGDWRLATRREWALVIADAVALGCTSAGLGTEPSLTNDPGMNCLIAGPSTFVGVQSSTYWTSSQDFALAALVVNLEAGEVGPSPIGFDHYIWPVRGGQ